MEFFFGGGRDCKENYCYNNFFWGGGWVGIVRRRKMPVTRRGGQKVK